MNKSFRFCKAAGGVLACLLLSLAASSCTGHGIGFYGWYEEDEGYGSQYPGQGSGGSSCTSSSNGLSGGGSGAGGSGTGGGGSSGSSSGSGGSPYGKVNGVGYGNKADLCAAIKAAYSKGGVVTIWLSDQVTEDDLGVKDTTLSGTIAYIIRGSWNYEASTIVLDMGDATSLTSLAGEQFSHARLTSVTLPSTLTSIGTSAFYLCKILESITIPASVTSIGKRIVDPMISSEFKSVKFENPVGWTATDLKGNAVELSSTDLAVPATAAKYLKSTYNEYIWTRQ